MKGLIHLFKGENKLACNWFILFEAVGTFLVENKREEMYGPVKFFVERAFSIIKKKLT